MKTTRFWLILIMLTGILPGFAGLWANAAGAPATRRPGELIVRFRPGAAPAAAPREAFAFTPAAQLALSNRSQSLKALDRRFGLREGRPLGAPRQQTGALQTKSNSKSNNNAPLAETWLLRLDPAANLDEALAAYRADPAVLYAEPNAEGTLAYVPSDPLYSRQSKNFKKIGLERAWDTRRGASASVEVAVIDSGVDAGHPDLAGAIDLANSYNFADGNAAIFDDIGHGTRVAGIVGATAANGEGIVGVAFGCKLMSLDVANSSGTVTTANVASAVDWAVARGADVINLSLTFSAFSQTLADACQAAVGAGVVVVGAAGNENQGERPVYPACYDGVLGVGAITADGQRCPWSNYNGTCATIVDLVAPGEAVFSTIPNKQYNGSYGSGTSFATPMVSGVAALLKTRYPLQSGQAIARHLLATAAPAGAGFEPAGGAGAGVLSASNAFATAMQPELTVETATVDDTATTTLANDGNGRLGRGENASLSVRLKNSGADIDRISATLTTADPTVTIGDGAGEWGAARNGESVDPSDPFSNIAVSTTAAAHTASFTLNVVARYNQTSFRGQTFTIELPVEAARTLNTGNFFSHQTWTADKTYEVVGTQNFNAGLTIQPGTTIKLSHDADININAGELTAEGSAAQPITFTNIPGERTPGLDAGPHNIPVDLKSYDKVYYVSAAKGSDATGDGSAAHPWASLRYAVPHLGKNIMYKPCAVLVAEGTYITYNYDTSGPGVIGVNIDPPANLDLYGGFEDTGWTRDIFAHPTWLDGNYNLYGITVNNHTKVDGFRYSNCYIAVISDTGWAIVTNNIIDNMAAGIGIGSDTFLVGNPTIANNLLIDNEEAIDYRGYGHPIISKNIVHNGIIRLDSCLGAEVDGNIFCNFANDGAYSAALCASCYDKPLNLTGNLFTYNSACVSANNALLRMTNNVCIDNRKPTPQGLIQGYSIGGYITSGTLTGNTIVNNRGPITFSAPQNPMPFTFINDIVYGNTTSTAEIIGSPATVRYSIVHGGFPGGSHVIDADPKLIGPQFIGMISRADFDPNSYMTRLTLLSGQFALNEFTGRVIVLNQTAYVVASNTENTLMVFGNAGTGSINGAAYLEEYHLSSDSPCINTGTSPVDATTDIDGEARKIGSQVDIGADEYNPAKPPMARTGGSINIRDSATGSLRDCTFQNCTGVFNDSAALTISGCTFNSMSGPGLDSTASALITSCTASSNLKEGINAPGQALVLCQGFYNGAGGLVGGTLTKCLAQWNIGMGLNGDYVTSCTALNNTDAGIYTKKATGCLVQENGSHGILGSAAQCSVVRNQGIGIVGSSDGNYVFGNGKGGVQGNATNSRIIGNIGDGVTQSTSITDCEIRDNSGAAASGASAIDTCTITGNGTGLDIATRVTGTYIAGNRGSWGVRGGAVQGSTIINTDGRGLLSPLSVSDSWVMFNTGVGIESPKGSITNSSICNNGGYGILNPVGGTTVNNCNLYGNATFEIYDGLNTASGGYPGNTIDFRHNYWGTVTTPQLTAHPFPSVNIARIFDLFDNNFSKGWYVNYGAKGEFATSPIASAPGDKAPAFLLSASPDASHPLNVGLAAFTLTFSRAMNTAVPPSVTFGTAAPYATYVVAPAPGWVNATTWQGSFAVQSDTAQGLNTLRVAGAVDATGFTIPDDTAHTFIIETSGNLSANNGLAVGHGIKMSLIWDEDGKPATAIGYNVMRSETGMPGTFERCNTSLVVAPSYTDSGLKPNTVYFYIVYIIDNGMNAAQWTPPFPGSTGDFRNAARDWTLYR